jgi:glycosyltransferase involved in cell wall biosynthesis
MKSLTFVLPAHDNELQLRRDVVRMLEVASETTNQFTLLNIDDGSTDDLFEVVSELAAGFLQISVGQHAVQPGTQSVTKHVRHQVKPPCKAGNMETARPGGCVNHNRNGTELRIGLIVLLFDLVCHAIPRAAKKLFRCSSNAARSAFFNRKSDWPRLTDDQLGHRPAGPSRQFAKKFRNLLV